MAKQKTLCIELTEIEANTLMVMLESEMETRFQYNMLDLNAWESLNLEAYRILAYRILAYHKFKTWYKENCDG